MKGGTTEALWRDRFVAIMLHVVACSQVFTKTQCCHLSVFVTTTWQLISGLNAEAPAIKK